jgi:hypothetical protein
VNLTWSILILTQARRESRFLALLDVLLPQAERVEGVEVVALRNYGGRLQWELASLRQAMLDDAHGRWVSFVDDDDMIDPGYVPTVLAAIADAPMAEFVAFPVANYEGGDGAGISPVPGKPLSQIEDESLPGTWTPRATEYGWASRVTLTGLQYGGWRNDADAYIRDITHINPVLAAHARMAGFGAAARVFESDQPSEDKGYAARLRPLLAGCEQAVISRVLYHYRHDNRDTVQSGPAPRTSGSPVPVITSPVFRWHPASEGVGVPS